MKSAAHTHQSEVPSSNVGSKNEAFFQPLEKDVQPFFGPAVIQPKLQMGEPDDPYEKQADRIADAVVQLPDSSQPVQRQDMEEEEELQMKKEPSLQRKCEECEEGEKLQKKENPGDANNVLSESISQKLQSGNGSGDRLTKPLQSEMSQKMGADFRGVNIHTDSEAARLNRMLGARAFTHGNDIYFNSGEFDPSTKKGKHLLAHELTHVVQQRNGRISKNGDGYVIQKQVSSNTSSRSIENMTQAEKWDIVFESALMGAGQGVLVALAILLGFILLIAIAAAIITYLCPACIAAIQAFLATTVMGITVGSILSSIIAAAGATVAISTLINEYQTVESAVQEAETISDLEVAGRNWGYRSGQALVELLILVGSAIPRSRRFLGDLVRRMRHRRSSSNQSQSRGSATTGQQAAFSFSLSSRRVIRYDGRDIVVVNTSQGPQGFYRRTGLGGGRASGHAGPQAGEWAPFDGIMPRWFIKNRYYDDISPDSPLYGYGNEEFRAAGRWLDNQAIRAGDDVGDTFAPVNDFLRSLGAPAL